MPTGLKWNEHLKQPEDLNQLRIATPSRLSPRCRKQRAVAHSKCGRCHSTEAANARNDSACSGTHQSTSSAGKAAPCSCDATDCNSGEPLANLQPFHFSSFLLISPFSLWQAGPGRLENVMAAMTIALAEEQRVALDELRTCITAAREAYLGSLGQVHKFSGDRTLRFT